MEKCWRSNLGGNLVTAAQYLAEEMCIRFAQKEGITLGEKFWRQPKWTKKFQVQLIHANNLLKEYSAEAITKALQREDAKKIYSLGYKSFLEPLIKREQKKINTTIEKIMDTPEPERGDIMQKPRTPFTSADGRKKLGNLGELDAY